jgi:hypothetical protein
MAKKEEIIKDIINKCLLELLLSKNTDKKRNAKMIKLINNDKNNISFKIPPDFDIDLDSLKKLSNKLNSKNNNDKNKNNKNQEPNGNTSNPSSSKKNKQNPNYDSNNNLENEDKGHNSKNDKMKSNKNKEKSYSSDSSSEDSDGYEYYLINKSNNNISFKIPNTKFDELNEKRKKNSNDSKPDNK